MNDRVGWGIVATDDEGRMTLRRVQGKLTDGHKALNAALSNLSWDTPTGPVKLDGNRQAISNNYLFKVTDGQSKLLKTVADVNQTLGVDPATYTARPANDRDNPSCK